MDSLIYEMISELGDALAKAASGAGYSVEEAFLVP